MRRKHHRQAFGLRILGSAVVAFAVIVAAGAAEAPVPCADCNTSQTLPSADMVPDLPEAPAGRAVPSDDPAVQAHLPGCAVWTDRCVVCQREAGKISCSNIGIACLPEAVTCLRQEPAGEK
jgi:hypothetical protein